VASRWPCWCPQLILWGLDSILMLAFPFLLVEKTHSLITWVKTLYSCKLYSHHSEEASIAFQNVKRHILAWLFCFGSKQTLRFHGFTLEKDNLSCALPVDLKRWLDDKLKKPFNSDYCKSKLLIWPMKTPARNKPIRSRSRMMTSMCLTAGKQARAIICTFSF